MKCNILAVMVVVANATAMADDFKVDAPVREAVLYHDTAQITRRAEVEITSTGVHRIVVPHILASDPATIQPVAEGAIVRGVSVQPDWSVTGSPLQEQIRELELNLELNEQAIVSAKAMMQALADSLGHGVTLDEVQSRQAVLQQDYGQLLVKRASWQRELRNLQKQLASTGRSHDEPLHALVFDLEVSAPGTVSLTWQAHTGDAYWQPSSEWSLDSRTGRLSIRANAAIMQHTGMDWSDVALVLAVVPPEYIYPPVFESRVVRAVDPAAMQPVLMAKMDMATNAAAMPVMKSPAPAVVEESGVDFRVVLPGKYHLPDRQTARSVTYWQNDIDAAVYSAVYDWSWPTDVALLMVEWTTPDGISILPGKMTLYRDGNIVTQLHQEMMAAGSRQVLGFGQDPQLLVKVKDSPGYTENHGLVSKSHTLNEHMVIEVTNHADADKNVRVYSRLPVSVEESVEVTPVWSPKPDIENVDDVKGLTLWEKNLPAKEKWQIESGFELEYPQGKQLTGL